MLAMISLPFSFCECDNNLTNILMDSVKHALSGVRMDDEISISCCHKDLYCRRRSPWPISTDNFLSQSVGSG